MNLTKAFPLFAWLTLAALLRGEAAPGAVPAEPDVRRDATVAAVEQVMPSVVNIATKTIVPVRDPFEQIYRDLFRRRPFDEYYNLGSGVVIDEAGYLLTNDHVVRRANVIAIKFANSGEVYEAVVVASDPKTDVALLKLNARPGEKFQAIKLAHEDDLLLGETVLALGNPFGLGGSVTRGILSSKSRTPPKEGEPLVLQNWLQTDAPINPGNSGGPLVNLRGELIGINVQNVPEAQSIGFAIPIKQVLEALSDIIPTEFVKAHWFGARVKVGAMPLVVTAVQPESPAGRAGVKPGDAILQVNGRAPRSFVDFAELLGTNVGAKVTLTLKRGAEEKSVAVQLVPESTILNLDLIRKKLGLALEPLTPEAAEQYLNSPVGFVITEVEENSPAARVGLRTRMLVSAIDGQVPADVMAIARLLYSKKSGDKVRLDSALWQRQGGYVVLRPQSVQLTVR